MDELSEAGRPFGHEAHEAAESPAGWPEGGHYLAMLDAMATGLLLATRPDPTRPHPVILWSNHTLQTWTGLGQRELQGVRLRRLRAADAVDPAFATLIHAMGAGESWSGELLVRNPAGTALRLLGRMLPLAGGPCLLVLEPATGRSDGADAADLPAAARLLADLLPGSLYRLHADLDAGLRLEWADPALERLTGYALPELQARGGLSGIVVPSDRPKLRKRNLELMAGISSEINYRIRTAHGAELRLVDRARPLRPAGTVTSHLPVERAVGMLRPASLERVDLSAPGMPLADFRLLADLLGAAILVIDADLQLLWVATNREGGLFDALQALGSGPLDDLLGAELIEDWRDRIEQALADGRRTEGTFPWPAAGQAWQIILERLSSETVLAVVRQVAAGKDGEHARAAGHAVSPPPADERLLRLVLGHVSDGVLLVGEGGSVRWASRAAERIFDLPDGGLHGATAANLFAPEKEADAAGERRRIPAVHEERAARRASGQLVPVEVAAVPLPTELAGGTMVVVRDVTLRKQTEETIRNLAYTDPLTGLPNRLLFLDRLSQAIERAKRGRQELAVMVLDLDRFKLINESLGLDKGDQVLRAVAQRIGAALRKSDTVARPGSDEFLILALATEGAEGAGKVAQKTLESLQAPFQIDGDEPTVAASIGISLFPFDGEHPDQLLKNAGTALARAKEQGSNSYQFYATDMNARAYQRLVLESRLRKAVEKGELLLHFQPLVGLAENRIVGVEALLRWNSPELGMIPPSDFIPIAEETGLILPIGDWVLRQAVAQMREWHAEGLAGLRIAVNISARQFQAADFVAKIRRLLADSSFPGPCLELELTESSIMRDVQDTVHRLRELTELGVRVTVDDFGTGYSSLAYLKRFPIGALKIDRSFIADVTTDANDAAIARAVVALAETLRVRVVGEGVETEEQLEFLRELGCNEAQGFLIGRPMPVLDAFARLRDDAASPA